MSQAEIERRLEGFAKLVHSDRETLRRKVGQLIRELNGGNTMVSYGPIHVDIIVQFEKQLNLLSDAKVSRALEILRE